MSRSIHRNRSRKQAESLDWDFEDVEAILNKREIKKEVLKKRKAPPLVPQESVPADAIPIIVQETDPFAYYPVSKEDIFFACSLLPDGVIAGLAEINLRPGVEYIEESIRLKGGDVSDLGRDPFLGRYGEELVEGVFIPAIRGYYHLDSNTVHVFSFAKDPEQALDIREEIICAVRMLETLIHEIGHHVDWMRRYGKDRWRMGDGEKAEAFTHDFTREWVGGALRECIEFMVSRRQDEKESNRGLD
jgi:hypothetical protein